MRPVATDAARSVVCVCVFLCVGAKTTETIKMPFGGGLTDVGTRNPVLDDGQDRTDSFAAARGDKTAMLPFPHYFGVRTLLLLL